MAGPKTARLPGGRVFVPLPPDDCLPAESLRDLRHLLEDGRVRGACAGSGRCHRVALTEEEGASPAPGEPLARLAAELGEGLSPAAAQRVALRAAPHLSGTAVAQAAAAHSLAPSGASEPLFVLCRGRGQVRVLTLALVGPGEEGAGAALAPEEAVDQGVRSGDVAAGGAWPAEELSCAKLAELEPGTAVLRILTGNLATASGALAASAAFRALPLAEGAASLEDHLQALQPLLAEACESSNWAPVHRDNPALGERDRSPSPCRTSQFRAPRRLSCSESISCLQDRLTSPALQPPHKGAAQALLSALAAAPTTSAFRWPPAGGDEASGFRPQTSEQRSATASPRPDGGACGRDQVPHAQPQAPTDLGKHAADSHADAGAAPPPQPAAAAADADEALRQAAAGVPPLDLQACARPEQAAGGGGAPADPEGPQWWRALRSAAGAASGGLRSAASAAKAGGVRGLLASAVSPRTPLSARAPAASGPPSARNVVVDRRAHLQASMHRRAEVAAAAAAQGPATSR